MASLALPPLGSIQYMPGGEFGNVEDGKRKIKKRKKERQMEKRKEQNKKTEKKRIKMAKIRRKGKEKR